jgi:hypothetical protein
MISPGAGRNDCSSVPPCKAASRAHFCNDRGEVNLLRCGVQRLADGIMTGFDFYSIGHSNIPAERFVALLRAADVKAVADVRSTPLSRFCPWFSATNLKPLLERSGIDYLSYGAALGGRPQGPDLYRDGIADYEAMARQPEFQVGLERLVADAARYRAHDSAAGCICLMCAEREPLDCHRCLLVARALATRGLSVGHILYDGKVEPHVTTEHRLLELEGDAGDLFATGQNERIAAAYRRRARAVAYRVTRMIPKSGNRFSDKIVRK